MAVNNNDFVSLLLTCYLLVQLEEKTMFNMFNIYDNPIVILIALGEKHLHLSREDII